LPPVNACTSSVSCQPQIQSCSGRKKVY